VKRLAEGGHREPEENHMASGKQSDTQFRIWMSSIQRQVHEATGLTASELPELEYRKAFDTGVMPEKFFEHSVRDELDKMGFALELHGLIDHAACEYLMAAETEEPYGEELDEAA